MADVNEEGSAHATLSLYCLQFHRGCWVCPRPPPLPLFPSMFSTSLQPFMTADIALSHVPLLLSSACIRNCFAQTFSAPLVKVSGERARAQWTLPRPWSVTTFNVARSSLRRPSSQPASRYQVAIGYIFPCGVKNSGVSKSGIFFSSGCC